VKLKRIWKKNRRMSMSDFKPGEFRITKKAMEIWKLPKGSKVLDIGCGLGETVEFLENEYGYECSGIDLSMARIQEGKTRNPSLNIKYGDGEFLEDFPSYSFDGVVMECTLSLINLPDEALHEAYCVLKKGGKLFVSDLYIKNPDPGFVKALQIEAERINSIPRKEGECGTDCEEEHKSRFVNFRSSGRFLIIPLIEQLAEIGYRNISWADCSQELENFVAEKLMKDGTLEDCLCDSALHPKDDFKTGYFMLTAEKQFKDI
jgi:ubiquinone/menaquinone biosynthesis C-methylase UbiE